MEWLPSTIGLVSGIMVVIGSPSLGYVVLRCISPLSPLWKAWKRFAASLGIGAGIGIVGLLIVFPVFTNPTASERIMEYAAIGGIGLFILTGMVSIFFRMMVHPALSSNPQPESVSATQSFVAPSAKKQTPAPLYKLSQVRANVPIPKNKPALEEPTLENDVLALLKQEESEANPSPRTQSSKQVPPERVRRPMSELSDFGGFDETLAQLKRDLKDFNESVSAPTKKHARNP